MDLKKTLLEFSKITHGRLARTRVFGYMKDEVIVRPGSITECRFTHLESRNTLKVKCPPRR